MLRRIMLETQTVRNDRKRLSRMMGICAFGQVRTAIAVLLCSYNKRTRQNKLLYLRLDLAAAHALY